MHKIMLSMRWPLPKFELLLIFNVLKMIYLHLQYPLRTAIITLHNLVGFTAANI